MPGPSDAVSWEIIGVLIAGLVAFGTATWVLASMLSGIRKDVRSVVSELADIKAESVTKAQFTEHQLRLALANRDLKVPDPRRAGVMLSGAEEGHGAGEGDQ